MTSANHRIFSLGDSALTVEFGNSINIEYNKKAIAFAARCDGDGFPGFIEAVPAYSSTTIFYDLPEVTRAFPSHQSAYDTVREIATSLLVDLDLSEDGNARLIEIPIRFDGDSTLDLDEISRQSDLSQAAVIEIFLARIYRVFMIGFLPGFSYMGEVDDRIATPRKASPRTVVPKGSVGIAGKQTGIYSLESPGGWQIIGRTDVELFTPEAKAPSLLSPGDQVRFIAVE
jgi:inhibitor of KinA